MVPGYVPAKDERTTVYLNSVCPGLLPDHGHAHLQGREFTAADHTKSRRVAIVNESFARRFFPRGKAIGRKFTVGNRHGSADNGHRKSWESRPTPNTPPPTRLRKNSSTSRCPEFRFGGNVIVRLSPGTSAIAASAAIRDVVGRLAKEIPVEISPYDKIFHRALQQDRMLALLSGLFGLLGIALACVGLYGVLSNAVSARFGEIGIRMALGAGRQSVIWMILRESMLLAASARRSASHCSRLVASDRRPSLWLDTRRSRRSYARGLRFVDWFRPWPDTCRPIVRPPSIRQMRFGRSSYFNLKLTSILTATGTGSLFFWAGSNIHVPIALTALASKPVSSPSSTFTS